jgi:xanthine dehydrogenase YagR molybdenum-binding subunit
VTESFVGKGVDRVDGRLKVTGKATYAAEFSVANVAYGVIVCASGGKGRLVALDAAAAEQSPGVIAVLRPGYAPKVAMPPREEGIDRTWNLLQDDSVAYDGQPIALVVAESLEQASEAARLLAPRFEVEKGAYRLDGERGGLYPPKGMPNREPDQARGDFEKAFAGAKVKVEATYTTPSQHHNPLEAHATIAIFQGDDKVTVYDSTQGISGVQKKVARVFGLKPENVRVISPFVGGGFGGKGSPWSHVGLAVLAAKHTGRAVKVVLTRPQMFAFVGHRPETEQAIALGADASGKLVAVKHEVVSYTSRVDDFFEPAALQTRMLYDCPNVTTTHRLVRLDVASPTFMRAPGESTGTFALESAMDELAYALKLDPLELRLKNYAERDPEGNKPWSSKELRACYKRAADRFGWAKRKPAPRSTRDGRYLVGMGVATATYPANQSPASAVCRLRPDGSALVQAGTQDLGTGTYTIMTQIAADALGLPIERVKFELGDSKLPPSPVSGGSMTASSVGSAVKQACLLARTKLVELATTDGPLKGAPNDDVDVAGGFVASKRDASKREAIADLVRRSGQEELVARVDNPAKEDRKKFSCHSFGAQFAEVKVDEDTGEVRVSRVVSAFAAGKILNAKTARSQMLGGIVWGIGFALTEHSVRDPRTGRVVTRDLADYHVPVNADTPDIEVIFVDEDDPHVNEIGAKGVGEIGITGVAAAIANAVFHATGKRVRDLPITLDKLALNRPRGRPHRRSSPVRATFAAGRRPPRRRRAPPRPAGSPARTMTDFGASWPGRPA